MWVSLLVVFLGNAIFTKVPLGFDRVVKSFVAVLRAPPLLLSCQCKKKNSVNWGHNLQLSCSDIPFVLSQEGSNYFPLVKNPNCLMFSSF